MNDKGYCKVMKDYLLIGYAKLYGSQRCGKALKTHRSKLRFQKWVIPLMVAAMVAVILTIVGMPFGVIVETYGTGLGVNDLYSFYKLGLFGNVIYEFSGAQPFLWLYLIAFALNFAITFAITKIVLFKIWLA
jgi:hypothetical protein